MPISGLSAAALGFGSGVAENLDAQLKMKRANDLRLQEAILRYTEQQANYAHQAGVTAENRRYQEGVRSEDRRYDAGVKSADQARTDRIAQNKNYRDEATQALKDAQTSGMGASDIATLAEIISQIDAADRVGTVFNPIEDNVNIISNNAAAVAQHVSGINILKQQRDIADQDMQVKGFNMDVGRYNRTMSEQSDFDKASDKEIGDLSEKLGAVTDPGERDVITNQINTLIAHRAASASGTYNIYQDPTYLQTRAMLGKGKSLPHSKSDIIPIEGEDGTVTPYTRGTLESSIESMGSDILKLENVQRYGVGVLDKDELKWLKGLDLDKPAKLVQYINQQKELMQSYQDQIMIADDPALARQQAIIKSLIPNKKSPDAK